MKIIDFETIKSIGADLDPSKYYDWIDYALKNKSEFQMPVKSRLGQANGDYYAVMPALYEKQNIAMVKMIGRHLRKKDEQRSTMLSDMLIYEADTGVLKALVDGEYITTARTGAAAAHSALLFGKKDFTKVGLIGLGNIMTVCTDVLFSKIKDRDLIVKLHKHNKHELRLVKRYAKNKNLHFEFCDTYEKTIKDSDVIISAVTRVTENFVDDNCYKPGCTVIPIMTLGFQNCDLFFDHIYTDEIDQIRGFKYFERFKACTNTIDVLNGIEKGRANEQERILVYNYGLAIHDLYFAMKYYELAENKGIDLDYRYCKEKFFIE